MKKGSSSCHCHKIKIERDNSICVMKILILQMAQKTRKSLHASTQQTLSY